MPELTLETEPLRARTQAALADPTLRLNLRAATDRLDALRGPALDQLADADALRSQARALRGRTIAQLPDLLETFVERLLDLGVHVHWADDAADAVACVTAVAQRRGVRTVVKSKSMAAEEIGLNAALESAGVDVVETDLGEWIIQVAQETPSHIIVPAIHKNRAQIAQTLRRVADGNLSDVPSELAAFARRTLRPAFLRAEMGISGVNFGVASAGSLVLVTNEGNGRLVTAAPAIHVAVMGMERLVADFAELDVMLALLARSATGQSLTAYTSLISGPRRPGEADGPDEVHVVILDNGRSAILGSELREILHCIRCGACLNVCPVYRQVGGHAYGWGFYGGPVGAVLTPLLARAEAAGELSGASSLCGACWQACPVGIPLQDLLLSLRRRDGTRKRAPFFLARLGAAVGVAANVSLESAHGPMGALAGRRNARGALAALTALDAWPIVARRAGRKFPRLVGTAAMSRPLDSGNRERFLGRLRDALARDAEPNQAHPMPAVSGIPAAVRYADAIGDLVDTFSRAATDVGVIVQRCPQGDVRDVVRLALERAGPGAVALSRDPEVDAAVAILAQEGRAVNPAEERPGERRSVSGDHGGRRRAGTDGIGCCGCRAGGVADGLGGDANASRAGPCGGAAAGPGGVAARAGFAAPAVQSRDHHGSEPLGRYRTGVDAGRPRPRRPAGGHPHGLACHPCSRRRASRARATLCHAQPRGVRAYVVSPGTGG